MKKLTAGFCAIALAAVPTAQAMAAPSIGTSGPKDPVVEEGTLDLKDGAKLVIKEVTPDLYEDNEVADVVENFNDEEKLTSGGKQQLAAEAFRCTGRRTRSGRG